MDWKRLLGRIAGQPQEARCDAPPPGFDPPPKIAPGPGDFACVPFVEPQAGSFTMTVPSGWRATGGLDHPAPGDLRPWYDTLSPDGIRVFIERETPFYFTHAIGQIEGQPLVNSSGMYVFNLKPRADRLGEHFVKTLARKRFGDAQRRMSRARPDVEAHMNAQRGGQGKCSADEILFEIGQGPNRLIASALSLAAFDGQYFMGMFANWQGVVAIYVAPAALAARAEAARSHFLSAVAFTPRLASLVQQDEMIIMAAGQAALIGQQQWFMAQQQTHQAQLAFGDAITQNYWSQQNANDAAMQAWTQRQATQDRLATSFDDALRGQQQLVDQASGKAYVADGGHNYYWIDQRTGAVVGTVTDTPPDYGRDYAPLKKL
jgi:hypothetical protein